MAYTALYREWRPKTFNDVVGQEHITTTLKNQILNHRIAHAYLFCGTRGTGKTSTAKDFAKADAIRDELLAKGIVIKDTREGVVWHKAE